jgi:hypothetical protein
VKKSGAIQDLSHNTQNAGDMTLAAPKSASVPALVPPFVPSGKPVLSPLCSGDIID